MEKYNGHTPGPWEVGVYNDGADSIGWLYRINYGEAASDCAAKANAILIADAPALLAQRDKLAEALRAMLKGKEAEWNLGYMNQEARELSDTAEEQARAALAEIEE